MENVLAQGRSEGRFVRHAIQHAMAVFPEKSAVEPVLTAFREYELILPGQLIEFEVIAGPIGLKFQLRVPEIIHPIAQFMHETLLVIGFRVAAATVAADLLEFELAD